MNENGDTPSSDNSASVDELFSLISKPKEEEEDDKKMDSTKSQSFGGGAEDLLGKLLDWSTSGDPFLEVDSNTIITTEPQDKDVESTILKKVSGEPSLNSPVVVEISKEELEELGKTAQEKKDIELREEKLHSLDDPFNRAVEADTEKMNLTEDEIRKKLDTLTELSDTSGKGVKKKMAALEEEIEDLREAKEKLQKQQEFVAQMKRAHEATITEQKRELEKYKEELEQKTLAFKEDILRRKKEKEDLLQMKMELEEREKDIKEKENILPESASGEEEDTEGKLKDIVALQSEILGELLKRERAAVIGVIKDLNISKDDIRRMLNE